MDAINEPGMPPDAPAPAVGRLTQRQLLEAVQTYQDFQSRLMRSPNDDATRDRMLARMANVTAHLESELRRHLADHVHRWPRCRVRRSCRRRGAKIARGWVGGVGGKRFGGATPRVPDLSNGRGDKPAVG
jgi:hypothetical protein